MKEVRASVAGVGMDVHYKFSKVTFRDQKGRVIRRQRLQHTDPVILEKQLSKWPKDVPTVMEGSFGWAWLSDKMIELGLDPHLSNCFKLEQMRRARGLPKTNKRDGDMLSLLPLEPTNWWEVWLAPPEVRDRRELMRYRAGLVALQTETKNRIHAVFHRHGIFHEFSDLFGGKGRQFLAELCGGQDDRLSPGSLAALRGHVSLLEHIRRQLAYLARRLNKELERTPLAVRLKGIPGFGLILSHVVIAEIGKIERFRNHRHLASYSLLAPIAHDTGEDRDQAERAPLGRHIGQRGNHTLKWAFIEAAHGAVRKGGKWRKMWDRYTQGGKKNRNRGYIKVARELAKVVYAVWKNGTTYSQTPRPRPGSRRPGGRRRQGREKSRSGTGQLSGAMVAAQ